MGGNKGTLGEMRDHQTRVAFHSDTKLDAGRAGFPLVSFMQMAEGLISEHSFKMFKSLVRFPLPTTSVTSAVFDRLSRIFEGRNPVYNYQFESRDTRDDWEAYRQNVLHEPDVWRTKAWEYLKTEFNSVIVVDMPVDGRTDKTDRFLQPYFYWVMVDDIVDFECDADGNFKWIIYKNADLGKVYAIDEKCYRVYDVANGSIADEGVERKHPLGYCPVKWFVSEPISVVKPNVKMSPLTKVLSDLDWYLFFATSKKYLDIYGSFPIYSGYQVSCDYETDLGSEEERLHLHCRNGVMCDEQDHPFIANGVPMECPHCGSKRMAGPGNYVEVPDPASADGHDMRNPINILSVDRKSLDYNTEELKRLKTEIISNCVGVDGDAVNQFSISDKQVDANFETQSTILLRVKKWFEDDQAFVDATICRLRYGREFQGCTINYGTEFYTMTTEQLRKRFKDAKDMGASESDLASLNRQIIETEYRTNPMEMQRMIILNDLEPLVGLTKGEAIEYANNGYADPEDVKVKVNFETLIRRFERENENILWYEVAIPYAEKIEKIKQILYTYVKNIRPNKIAE